LNTQPYICKVHIENFRNFRCADFRLNEKQVIIGENNVGKSNLLYAIQLILDPALSDRDRFLDESDFFEGIENPIEKGAQILIEIYIANYEDNKNVLAQLTDATVQLDGKEVLKLTYKFFPSSTTGGKTDYRYIIFKGDDENRPFSYDDRKMLNIRVIKAIRDVESDMRNSRTSPLTQIIKQKYAISKDVVSEISKALEVKGADMLQIGEISDLESKIRNLLNSIVSYSRDEFNVSLRTMNIDATKLLYALRPLIDNRESGNTSLGVNNVLYVALMLLLIEDDTIRSYLPTQLYDELITMDTTGLISRCYEASAEHGGYVLKVNILEDKQIQQELYQFMYESIPTSNGATILVIEEPEAHLHPIYQRLLYKYVMSKANASLIITTHSTHVSSVAPINSIVHLIRKPSGTEVKTTAEIQLTDAEFNDLERYIDVKRGEIYLAKGIIFVEGISEEYLVPCFAKCFGYDLDRLGIVICNVNSTNFLPYRAFANALGIPNVILTDGDYYHTIITEDGKEKKKFGDLKSDDHKGYGYAGIERAKDICQCCIDLLYGEKFDELEFEKQVEVLNSLGVFIGNQTFEIDIFQKCEPPFTNEHALICSIFKELTDGGEQQINNFVSNFSVKAYDKCLRQIESSHSGIGKGRFAQRLSSRVTANMAPDYVCDAIIHICKKVKGEQDD